MVKKYRDVQVIDLLCIYEVQGEETPCDADNQEVVIESATYEWLTGTYDWKPIRPCPHRKHADGR
ncbi:hypothetical protein EJ896_17565 [Klebsiella quasipneumoniae subsp. similipneumoniae]|nr:hypothetical protein EJ896_17565 [Klebsiella quasipneumoniae subsp. similipneumoniae]